MVKEKIKAEFTRQIADNQKILKKNCHIYGVDHEDRLDLFHGKTWGQVLHYNI